MVYPCILVSKKLKQERQLRNKITHDLHESKILSSFVHHIFFTQNFQLECKVFMYLILLDGICNLIKKPWVAKYKKKVLPLT